MQLDVVIPCFNEEAVLNEIHLRVKKILEEVKEKKLIDGYNIIYVDELDGQEDSPFNVKGYWGVEEGIWVPLHRIRTVTHEGPTPEIDCRKAEIHIIQLFSGEIVEIMPPAANPYPGTFIYIINN